MLSVIIPAKNAQSTILNAVDSVLTQNFSDFEILIGVDKSLDATIELLNKYKNFSNIRIYEFREPMGTSRILNQLIQYANGDYIVRMDADDLMIKNRLKLQFDFLDQNPVYGVLASRSVMIQKPNTNSRNQSRQLLCADFLNINPISHPTIVFRKHVVANSLMQYNSKYRRSQDFELWTRLVRETNFYFLDIPAILYNSNPSFKKIVLQFYFFGKAKFKNLLWHLFIKNCDCSYRDIFIAVVKIPKDFKILFADILKIIIN